MEIQETTVVIPTRNEAQNIGFLLATLPKDMSLIVIDRSHDGTPDMIRRLRPEKTEVIRRSANITEARQIGAEMAGTKWLLFTDADIVFPDGYFSKLQGLNGAEVFYGPKLSQDRFRWYYRAMAVGQEICHALGAPAASGSNLLIERQALLRSGGFDLDLNCNEDSEVVWRLARAGNRTRFCRELFVYATDHRRLEGGLSSKTIHSLARCTLLYSGLLSQAQKRSDWGYWKRRNPKATFADCGTYETNKE
jgi:glycosyltransferase involved in cell wall biosynthesis